MRSTAFFKLYKICILLHRCNLKIFAKNRFEKTAIFVKFQQKNCKCLKIWQLQNFVKFQKFQLENLVDFEKCCKTHIFLQKSEPIQPKTSSILPKICQKFRKMHFRKTSCGWPRWWGGSPARRAFLAGQYFWDNIWLGSVSVSWRLDLSLMKFQDPGSSSGETESVSHHISLVLWHGNFGPG